MVANNYKLLTGLLLVGLSTSVAVDCSRLTPCVQAAQVAPKKPPIFEVRSQLKGMVLVIGTEIKKGEPGFVTGKKIEVKNRLEVRVFRQLQEGDRVLAGQMLAQLDDRLARLDFQAKEAMLCAAQEKHVAAVATTKIAQQRLAQFKELKEKAAVTPEEYNAGVLARDQSAQEETSKREAVKLAERALLTARITLEMHTIRSPIGGVVHTIHKNHGEGVRMSETIFEIEAVEKK